MSATSDKLIARGNLEMERAAVLQATMPDVIAETASSREELHAVIAERHASLTAIREWWSKPEHSAL